MHFPNQAQMKPWTKHMVKYNLTHMTTVRSTSHELVKQMTLYRSLRAKLRAYVAMGLNKTMPINVYMKLLMNAHMHQHSSYHHNMDGYVENVCLGIRLRLATPLFVNSPDLFEIIIYVENNIDMKKCKVESGFSTTIGACSFNGRAYEVPIF